VLTRIELRHFKCFELLKLPLAPLTLLAGANASGKSTVLQAIGLLHQTVKDSPFANRLLLNGSVLRLGSAVDVIEQRVDVVERHLLEGIESVVEFALAGDDLHLALLKRVAGRLIVDAVAIERSEFFVVAEAERLGEPVHGAGRHPHSFCQLAHGERGNLARVLQNVGGALLELPAELGKGPRQAIGPFAELHAHR